MTIRVLSLCALAFSLAPAGEKTRSAEALWDVSKTFLKDPFLWTGVWRNAPVSDSNDLQTVLDQPAPAEADGKTHYLAQSLFVSAPLLIVPDWKGRVFPRECGLKPRTTNASAVLQLYDEVVLSIGADAGVKPGDLFRTYEVGPAYQAFSSDRELGRLVESNGIVKVIKAGAKTSLAKVIHCFGTISPKAKACPLEAVWEVTATGYAPLPEGKQLAQVVWVSQGQQFPQPYSYALLDQGSAKGFKLGDVVLFYNRNAGRISDKVLGRGIVVGLQKRACVVSIQDIYPGIINRGDFVVAVQTPSP